MQNVCRKAAQARCQGWGCTPSGQNNYKDVYKHHMQEKIEKKGLQQISTAGYHSKLDLFQGALLGLFVLQKSEGAEGQTAVGLQQRDKVRQTICKSVKQVKGKAKTESKMK